MESYVLTTGTQLSGTFSDTEQLDGVRHEHTDDAGAMDLYYEFNIGVSGVPIDALVYGRVNGSNDTLGIYGYDWISASWKQIGSWTGTNSSVDTADNFKLTSSMVGSGANEGIVRVRFFAASGLTSATLRIDRLLLEYTSLAAESLVLHTGIAQAGSSNTITLDVSASSIDGFYSHANILIVSGTGQEQERIIVGYNGTTKVATIAPPWKTTPDNTSAFDVVPGTVHAETNSKTVKVGLAQAATASTITLSADAISTDEYYTDDVVEIDSGTGEGQARIITSYNGTTKVATISPFWIVTGKQFQLHHQYSIHLKI